MKSNSQDGTIVLSSKSLGFGDPSRVRPSAFVQSLGCAPNQADGKGFSEFLSARGWMVTTRPEEATAAIIFTCGFTEEAESANLKRLREVRSLLPPGGRLLIGGCLPAIAGARLGDLTEGAFLFSPRDILRLEAEFPQLPSATITQKVVERGTGRRTIRISTGCMSQCTFCAIPYAAGKTRSRPVDEITAEIRNLTKAGVQEFRLTSEDVSAYGLDLGTTCVALFRAILETTDAAHIILDTLNPKWLRNMLEQFRILLRDPRIDRRLYIPIQSASDKVLLRMARGYTSSHLRSILDSLLAEIPDLQISTDFIVGFPGESDEDFKLTQAMASEYPFRFIEVFRYAEREGTPAATFGDRVPRHIAELRARLLLSDFLEAEIERAGADNTEGVVSYLERTRSFPLNTNVLLHTGSLSGRASAGVQEVTND